MKRKLLALVLSCLICVGLAAPAYGAVEELADLRVDQIAGYSQEDGIYTVIEDGLYGFCRTDGTQLLPSSYAAAGDFHNGMAAVSFSGERIDPAEAGFELLSGGRFGYMDASGTLAVPMQYSRAFPYCEDRAFAVHADSGVLTLLDRNGQQLAAFPEAEIPADATVRFSEGLAVFPVRSGEEGQSAAYLVVDTSGQEVCRLTDAYVDFSGGYHSGRIAVASDGEWTEDGTERRFVAAPDAWGYRDTAGELAVEYRYARAGAFSGGLAAVAVRNEGEELAYGLISPDGEAVAPASYEGAVAFANGMGAVARGGRWAYVNRMGQTLTGFIYDEPAEFREGVALARSEDQLRALDERGTALFSLEGQSALPVSGGLAVVRRADGLCGICDLDGNLLVPFEYEDAFHWDGYLWLKRGNLWRVYAAADVIEARRDAPEAGDTVVGVFSDVPSDSWYAAAVTWATDHDIVTGTGGGQFSPDKLCTTGEVVAFLWRAVGRPEPETENPFTDVTPNHYYYQAALWAYENGMAAGEVFGAAEMCTRSMAVTYLWKLAGCPVSGAAFFTDVPPEAEYAQAVAWAVAMGVTDGSGERAFSPDAICSRGQIVTFLYRYLEMR
ncbi:MAG: WG repeat-containing protein [Oscillospiraceae bacterium]|nr:WG repeat-containing protein [Oscillospiraceae bacterium]